MIRKKRAGFMTQAQSSQETLPEQFGTVLLALERIAQSYFTLGHLEQALQIFQIGMQVLHNPEVTQRDQAEFLSHYGNMLAAKTQFANAPVEEALSLLEQAKQLAIALSDVQLLADALDSIGFAQYVAASNNRAGDPLVFRASFQDALERRRVLSDNRGISESLFHLGLAAQVLDEMEVARSCYTQALQIARQHGYLAETSDALRHLGFLEQEQGNIFQAQQYLTESLHLREHIGKQVYLPFAHVAVADVYLVQGNVELAFFHSQKALELSRGMDIKKALIFSLSSCGRVCQAKQDEEQAKDYFEQAYVVAQAIDLKYAMHELSSTLQHLSANPRK